MRLAVVAAGFTPGEADQLRRAMAAWRRPGVIDQFRKKLLDGMRANGLPEEFAQRVYQQIEGFGEYGFPESHAASFALLVYVSAWLKHYYPAAFAAALINSQPMGFYAAGAAGARCARARRRGAAGGCELQPVGLHAGGRSRVRSRGARSEKSNSFPIFTPRLLAGPRAPRSFLRLGLRMLNGLREAAGEAIERARARRPVSFRSTISPAAPAWGRR